MSPPTTFISGSFKPRSGKRRARHKSCPHKKIPRRARDFRNTELLDSGHNGARRHNRAIRANDCVFIFELIRVLEHERERPGIYIFVLTFLEPTLGRIGFKLDEIDAWVDGLPREISPEVNDNPKTVYCPSTPQEIDMARQAEYAELKANNWEPNRD